MPKNRIVNEIFVEMMNAEEDDFWKDIFDKASKGSFRTGFTFRNNTLFYRFKTKRIPLSLTNDIDKNIIMVKEFMNSHAHIYSDNNPKINVEYTIVDYSKINSWKDINKYKYSETAIWLYIIEILTPKYRLKPSERCRAYDVIKMGIILKNMDDSITVEKGKITDIGSLVFDKNRRYFSNSNNNYKPAKSTTKKSIKPAETAWLKILEKFEV